MLASDEYYLDVYTPFPSHKRFVFNYIPPTRNSLLSASYYRMLHTILSELTYTYLPFEGRIMVQEYGILPHSRTYYCLLFSLYHMFIVFVISY